MQAVSGCYERLCLDQSAFDELAAFVDPAAVPGSHLVLISGTYVGLKHHGGIGGLD